MKKTPVNSSSSKSKALICLECALIVLSLGVLALRTIFTEGPAVQSTTLPANISDSLYSLSVSVCLLGIFLLWLAWNICSKKILYRPTGIGIGLILFCIAAVISCFAASDKRLAITTVFVAISPILCAIVLVQILDSPAKVNLVLAAIAALGVLSAYQCFEQLIEGNKVMITQYEENPQSMLEPLGIEPGTLQHFLFEHRLYAGNVRAFFTTRNSAGSFLLLSFFTALALYLNKLKNHKSGQSKFRDYAACIIPIGVILVALVLTKSKGAIIGLIFAALLIVIYICFKKFIKAHRKIIFATCVSLFIAGGIAVFWYGLKHDKLPGGNSMLVRWQYWRASAKMYADHPLTGVGPGNFTSFYSHYKPASSLESVSDPHNFPLSVLTQYGPLGLTAMLAMIFVPMWKVIFPKSSNSSEGIREPPPVFIAQIVAFILFVWLGVLLVMKFLIPAVSSGDIAVLVYIITRFIIPASVVFIVSFLLFRIPNDTNKQAGQKIQSYTVVILFCVVLGFFLHNLTDFAFFEPGVYTTFWFVVACLVAADSFVKPKRLFVLKSSAGIKIVTLTTVFGVSIFFIKFAIVPLASSTVKIEKANHAISQGRFGPAILLLDKAAVADKLSPLAPSLNARLCLHLYKESADINSYLLICAEEYLKTAIERNNADFKNYEKLTEVYLLMSEQSDEQEKTGWLKKALSTASKAVKLYPGCDRLHFNLAQIADKLGKTDVALKEYKKTIETEEQYRDQFRQMFPAKNIVSRLGEDKYQIALIRIKELSITPQNNPGEAI
jgi:O-antigen ligase/tetratricopeptide (TPR) repeat protein